MTTSRETAVTQGLLIGGERVETETVEEVRAPFDGALIGRACLAGEAELERAIVSGLGAFETTRTMPRHARRRVLRAIAERLRKDREGFARTMALEAGKPIAQARAEVDRAVLTYEIAAEELSRLGGEMVPLDIDPRAEEYEAAVYRMPLGLVAGISPFNFPLNLVAHKAAPAFAAGNALVLKPARKHP